MKTFIFYSEPVGRLLIFNSSSTICDRDVQLVADFLWQSQNLAIIVPI